MGSDVPAFTLPAQRRLGSTAFSSAGTDTVERRVHSAGPWHVVALQEAIEFHEDDAITRQFHVAHLRGCAALFNKDTFEPDLQVKSIYLPSDKENCSG